MKKRSLDRFGDRALPGGDLYEQEKAFFDLVKNRPADLTQQWLKTISLPILYIDGRSPIEENATTVLTFLKSSAIGGIS